ncbi:hypothetical protein DS2_18458 [Catenovulum agarivorans DS-2]|uniref:Outer membrane protein beta-barrel domain-containing protein n=1 Tax=Catenovulum agarivorans DS-2 TaxID=1328313 RepID=W7QH05_9ALTE|nr:outer membrane beta-barrel protein [Catenovulum agarivorans]EWH08227.1 hypothetical protein DS2_18458 [Catenovulum agarivorans DS-2]
MKFKHLLATTASASLLLFLPNVQAHDADVWQNRVSLILGQKKLDDNDFADDSHGAFGIMADFKRKSWPVSIAVDLLAAGQDSKEDGRTLEEVTGGLHLGIRKYWMLGQHFEPFLGGGINLAVAERQRLIDDYVVSQDDEDVGVWLAAGVNWRLDKNFVVGLQARYTEAEAELFNSQLDTGGVYSLLSVGYQF